MSELETIVRWMIANSLATGHGDTVDDLLNEAAGQIAELRGCAAWAAEWHKAAETMCLLAGVSQGLGADEMVVAFRETNDALRAHVAKLETALKEIIHREPWKGRKDCEPGDAGLADYWSDMAKEFQEAARAALSEAIS